MWGPDTPEARAGNFPGIGLSSVKAFLFREIPVVVPNSLSGELATRGIFDILERTLDALNLRHNASANKWSRDDTLISISANQAVGPL